MRFVVIGTSGAGKTTFARTLATALHVPHIELDEINWQPDWTQLETDEFRARVARATAKDSWVVDGNYSAVRSVLWPNATHIIWLNFDRRIVFKRVFTRTLRRIFTRQTLWAGNTETFGKAFLSRDSILLWALMTYKKNRIKYAALQKDAEYAHLQWHELRTPEAARSWLCNSS